MANETPSVATLLTRLRRVRQDKRALREAAAKAEQTEIDTIRDLLPWFEVGRKYLIEDTDGVFLDVTRQFNQLLIEPRRLDYLSELAPPPGAKPAAEAARLLALAVPGAAALAPEDLAALFQPPGAPDFATEDDDPPSAEVGAVGPETLRLVDDEVA